LHSTKLPNPSIFKDTKDISLFNWISQIKNKLCENANHYLTKSIKLALVEGLIRGKAAKHISLHIRDNAINLYITIQDLFDYLTFAFKNLNQLFIAKNKFKKLFIKSTQLFYKFYIKFLQLAFNIRKNKNVPTIC